MLLEVNTQGGDRLVHRSCEGWAPTSAFTHKLCHWWDKSARLTSKMKSDRKYFPLFYHLLCELQQFFNMEKAVLIIALEIITPMQFQAGNEYGRKKK